MLNLVNAQIKEPGQTAKSILEDAINNLQHGNIDRTIELMKEVKFNLAVNVDKSEGTKLESLLMATKFILVAEVFVQSIIEDKKYGKIVTPFRGLTKSADSLHERLLSE